MLWSAVSADGLVLTVGGGAIGTTVMGGKKCRPKTGAGDVFGEGVVGADPVTKVKKVIGGNSEVVTRTVTRGRCPSAACWVLPLPVSASLAGEGLLFPILSV